MQTVCVYVCVCVLSQLVCMPAAAIPALSGNQGEIVVCMLKEAEGEEERARGRGKVKRARGDRERKERWREG